VPGLGPYCATKYAVEGLIESMLYEIDAYGIKATLVAPGHLRIDEPDALRAKGADKSKVADSDVAGDKMPLPSYGHFLVKTPSAPYAHQNSPAGHAKRMVQWMNDNQPTSAVKSAELVWQLGHCSFPPLRLLLGSYAVESIRDRLRSIIEEVRLMLSCPCTLLIRAVQIEDWKHLSFPTAEDEQQRGKGKEQDQDQQTEIADDDQDLNMGDDQTGDPTLEQMNGYAVESEHMMEDEED